MGGGGGGNNGVSSIPAGSRKIVQSLKEIVNCPEQEIYSALRDCNMDPNEAVNRLLSQDPFHEVKSKREKKKENKDTTDAKPRNSASSRGGRTSTDRYGVRGRVNASSSSEATPLHGKAQLKKENGSHAYTGPSTFASVASGNSGNQRSWPISDPSTMEKGPSLGENDLSGSLQHTSGFQSAWSGIPGQVSMADIVKMGKPHGKVSGSLNPQNNGCQNTVTSSVPSPTDFHLLPGHSSSKNSTSQNVSAYDDWPLDESQVTPTDEWPSFVRSHAAVEPPVEAKVYEPSNISLDRSDYHLASQMNRPLPDDRPLESPNYMSTTSISSRNVQEEGHDGPLFDTDYKNDAPFQSHPQAYEHSEDEDSAGVAGNLQHLSLEKEDEDTTAEEDGPAVVIPDHLQVHALDCQYLSFGSFSSGVGATFSGSVSSRSMKNNLGEVLPASDAASVALPDIRNPEHYGDDHLRSTSDADDVHGTATSTTNYDSISVSQAEVMQPNITEPDTENQYSFASAPAYSYDNSQSLNTTFTQPQTSTQMQNLSPFSGVLPAYTSSLPSALLQSAAQTGTESDLPYLPFPQLPQKYSNVSSSVGSSSISTAEGFRGNSISAGQQQTVQQQTAPSASPAPGGALHQQQHLAMQHPYAQPTLPLAPFTNMVYPFLPQSYSYMPSAFQQAFAAAEGNNTFPQSLAAVLPQYKNNLSGSSLPQQSGIPPSGYGGFGSSNSSTPGGGGGGGGSFLNQPAAPAGTSVGYDDPLTSQYKEANHLLSLQQQQQQNDNSAMWMNSQGSQAVPANNYYNYQNQSQQLRQAQTLSQQQQQHYGALGYPNYYQSAGISMEQLQLQQQQLQQQQLQQLQQQQQQLQHQQQLQQQQHLQQMARDGSLMGSQVQPKQQQQQQLWQNTY